MTPEEAPQAGAGHSATDDLGSAAKSLTLPTFSPRAGGIGFALANDRPPWVPTFSAYFAMEKRAFHARGVSEKSGKVRKPATWFLLPATPTADPLDLDAAVAAGTFKALRSAIEELKADGVIAALTESGMRGRGTGGLPIGEKWRACTLAAVRLVRIEFVLKRTLEEGAVQLVRGRDHEHLVAGWKQPLLKLAPFGLR